SITVRASTPSSARHNLTLRTSLPAPLVPDLRQARNLKRQRRAPFHINNAPTEVSEEPEFLGIGAKVPVAKCSNTCRRNDGRARVLALSEGLGVRSGRDVVKDDGIVGVAPYFVAVLAADLAITQLERVHEPHADSSARFKWAVREPVTGQRE